MRGKRERRGSVLRAAALLLGAAGLVAGIAAAAAPTAAADSALPTARSEMARSHTARSHTADSRTARSRTVGSGTGRSRTALKATRKPAAPRAYAGTDQVGAGGDGGAGTGPTTGAAGAVAATKPLVRVSRVRTAMSIAITPAHPYRNGRLVASGTVTQLTAKGWVRLPHAHVVLVYRPRGSSQWYWVLKGHADATGRYTFATRVYADGTWAVYLDPDSRHLYSESRKVYVTVR